MARRQKSEKFQQQAEEFQANKPIIAKNQHQKDLLASFNYDKISLAVGSAGTGKTYLSARYAAQMLHVGKIERIVIGRPYVTMGKSTGFWPGEIKDKLMPFLLPMVTNIADQLGTTAEYCFNKGIIEIQPIEAIRGMSFDDPCIIIIDEAQNLEPHEVRSIVTRIGAEAQLFLCGDTRQKDIRGISGIDFLINTVRKHGIPEIGIVEFDANDIVRDDIVARFVKAFDKDGWSDDVSGGPRKVSTERPALLTGS